MTTYHLRGTDGTEVFTGTIEPPPGSGSQTVKAVDLGIIDLAAIFASGPVTLYAMQPGEFLANVRFTDLHFEELDQPGLPPSGFLIFGIGTVKSFGWQSFASFQGDNTQDPFDTTGSYLGNLTYGPALDAVSAKAMVLSAAAGGDIQASFSYPGNDDDGWRVGPGVAWQAATSYRHLGAAAGLNALGAQLSVVVENGTVWYDSGADGTSGGSKPDFAGNAGGTVTDGPDIVWTDSSAAPLTTGKVQAVAEIWTPAAA